MPVRLSLSIATRMAFGLLTLGLVALGGAGATYLAMDAQAERVAALTHAADGPPLVERLRAGVYAVVMESRGLYIASDEKQAAGFANNLRGHLAQVEANWRQLHDLLPTEEQARSAVLDGAMARFVALRTELARIGVMDGAQAADTLGNNDANRSAREAFSHDLDELAEATAHTVKQLEAGTVANGRRVALTLLVATSVAVVIALGVIMWLLRRSVSQPLRRLAGALGEMADGHLDDVVLPSPSQDEVGGITAAAKVFLEKLTRSRELEAAAVAGRAARDRQVAAIERHTQDFGTSVSGVMASLGQSAGRMQTAANEMSEAASRTRHSTSHAVEGANASARDLNSVAVAAEQMAASIGEISRQVAHVTTAVTAAVERAAETDRKVASLSDTADRIGDVVRLITDIAGQTNLLALNATIEAARAGDAGKGFAVVASEVKTLATQTARATAQIGAQIVAIRASTSEAVEAVRDVGQAIGQVAQVATAIAAAVEQQAAATQEISASVQNVTQATNNAAQAMEQVLTIAEQTDTASSSVLIAAGDVGQSADTLRVEVDDFLSAMKQNDGDDRRAYERIPGAGATVSLTIRGSSTVQAVVRDISRGGIALTCRTAAPSGTGTQVSLPTGATVSGRIVRYENETVTIAFRQDAASLAALDRALAVVKQRTLAAVA
jgi:methyl-accepting chemotaxis protein